jgi:hypothetical protein
LRDRSLGIPARLISRDPLLTTLAGPAVSLQFENDRPPRSVLSYMSSRQRGTMLSVFYIHTRLILWLPSRLWPCGSQVWRRLAPFLASQNRRPPVTRNVPISPNQSSA